MTGMLWLVKREMRRDKWRTVGLCLIVACAEACLFAVFSLGGAYYRLFLEQATLSGEDPSALAMNGFGDVAEVIGILMARVFSSWLDDPTGFDVQAWNILSGEAALKNLPAFILLTVLAAFVAVCCAVDLMLAVYRRQQRHFLNSLLVGGADETYISRFVTTQTLCVWFLSLPFALALGAAELAALRVGASVFFVRNIGIQIPIDIRGGFVFFFAAALTVFLPVLFGFRKNLRGLSVRNAAQGTRRQTGASMGISTFSGEPVKYRILGLPHFIALRNIEDCVGRYLKIFFMTTIYLSTAGCMMLLLTFIRNYQVNAASLTPGGEAFLAANEFYFCASSALIELIATVGTKCCVISHITSHLPEYAQLRAAGASLRCVRRCAAREGVLCVAISLAVAAFWIFLPLILFSGVYEPHLTGIGLDYRGIGKPLAVIGVLSLLYTAAVITATGIAARRVDRLDLPIQLKELSYS